MRKPFFIVTLLIFILLIVLAYFFHPFIWVAGIFGLLLLIGIHDITQKQHAILRNFPIVGHFRYIFEMIRPELQQYFIESDIDGRPVNKVFRSLIYQRAKGVLDTNPFGTKTDVYRLGYEWINHSLSPVHPDEKATRIMVGGPDCSKPYFASRLNVSAMSFGALSSHAITALNKGAKEGNFAHNTGEGSFSHYHQAGGGDTFWQIGTGYFGCRTPEGGFSAEKFRETAQLDQIKMIEIKLSQGAKPGHGGILPAAKNTPEIAKIRGVEPHIDIISPPAHTAFNSPVGMMEFIKELRELSGGKPIGFKICIGNPVEFMSVCKAMVETGIKPDFITIDGGEGGTGAAPLEFSNSVGMPLKDALTFAVDILNGYDLKKDIRVIASGKIFTGFHMVRALAMGADMCNSARGMMFALGCIQALRCNNDKCPTGVATQDPELVKGLDIDTKAQRVAGYQKETVESFTELLGACGVDNPDELHRYHIHRRVSESNIASFEDIFPTIEPGSFLNGIPTRFDSAVARSCVNKFCK